MKKVLPALFALSISFGAVAQPLISETEEQYARSQVARTEAIAAFRSGDLETAYLGMMQALEDRPNNAALLGNAIFLAAETGKLEEAASLSKRYLAMGIAPGAGIQAKLKEKLPAGVWVGLEQNLQALLKPLGTASIVMEIPAEHRLVEGIAADQQGGYFLSTVVSGSLVHVTKGGEVDALLSSEPNAPRSFFGLAYSAKEQSLYATYGRVDQTPGHVAGEGKTGVLRISATTKEITGDWQLSGGTGSQQIADIAISPAGKIFVSEAQSGGVYEIEGDKLSPLETGKTFRSPQGMAFIGETLWMADYGRGLWKIAPDTNTATLMPVADDISLVGIDGLLAHKDTLFAIQNGVAPHRILRINVADNSVRDVEVLARNIVGFDEPTLGTSTHDGILIVASSQWPKFAPGGEMREGQSYDPTKIMLIRD